MAWTRFCTEKPGYNHLISSANHAACPYCGEANPDKPVPGRQTSTPEIIEIPDSPPALQSTRYAPSYFSQPPFALLGRETNQARNESMARTRISAEIQPNAGSIVHSARPQPNAGSIVHSARPQPSTPPIPLKAEFRFICNDVYEPSKYTCEHTAWRPMC